MLGRAAAFTVSAMVNFPWRVLATQQLSWFAFALIALQFKNHRQEQFTQPAPRLIVLSLLLAAFAGTAAAYPARWFLASHLIKQGNLGRDQKNAPKALPFYQKAVNAGLSGSQKLETMLYLGSMQNLVNEPQKALDAFNSGIEGYPDFIEARYNTGYTYMTLYEKTRDEKWQKMAEEAFLTTLDLNPRYVSALNNLGNIYYARRELDKAGDMYRKLIRFNPNIVEAHFNLAMVELMGGNREQAQLNLKRVLEIKPDYQLAQQWLDQLQKLPAHAVIQFQ